MCKAIKIGLIICSFISVTLIILHISVIGICWGLDIFKTKDLADFIGWDNIEYVTADDTYINLILHSSSYDSIENKNNLSETERVLNYLERINSYINSNDHYKKMKVKIQYGERLRNVIGLSNVVTFANYSLSGKNEERYDGFYSIMWEDGIPIEFGFFHVSPWNNMRDDNIIFDSDVKFSDDEIIQLESVVSIQKNIEVTKDLATEKIALR